MNKTNIVPHGKLLLSLILLISATTFAQTAATPSGSGSSSDPYQIATLNNLYWLSQNSGSWDKYSIQTADIDASTTSSWNSGSGFSPIGNNGVPFTGFYNAQGHTISGLSIQRSAYSVIGFFGFTSGATIDSLGLVNVAIKGHTYVGGLVGWNYSSSTINNCYATGIVVGNEYVGGLVGWNYSSSTINNCYAMGSVSGEDYIGGLVGDNQSYSTITNCYARGLVDGSVDVGGLVGVNKYSTVSNCYATDTVSGTTYVGGLVGINNSSTINKSFWNTETSGMSSGCGTNSDGTVSVTGETTALMKTKSTFTDAGWDFFGETANGVEDIWAISSSVNNGYPSFNSDFYTPDGSGTSSDPYQIHTLKNLYWLSQNSNYWVWPYCFVQTADINASGTSSWDSDSGFSPIGNATTVFVGSYNGRGHIISGLTINRPLNDYAGLFGYVKNATIDSLGLSGCSIQGGSIVGGIVGTSASSSTVKNCYATGSITGKATSGGLVGHNANSSINNCYAVDTVTGIITGGFVGLNDVASTVNNCYAAGPVSGTHKGGLVGTNASGSAFRDCFWDNQTTGLTSGYYVNSGTFGAAGKTTTLMKTQSTYTDSSWDFLGETAHGTANIWGWGKSTRINNGYPCLAWQDSTGELLPVELTSITATATGTGATLTWSTATETNNYGFEVERRTVGTTVWTDLGFVSGNGTSSKEHAYSYTDKNVSSGTYAYRLKQIDNDGASKYSSEVEVTISVPLVFALNQNYPNPFNPTTTMTFTLAKDGNTTLKIYDILGREVATLVNGHLKAGVMNTATWNASKLASGVYFSRLESSGSVQMKKMMILK